MRIFPSSQVEAAFEKLAIGKLSVNYQELAQEKFFSYDEFERHQFEKRKPVWIDALLEVSGCTKRENLEEQWDLFGKVFRRFHSKHIEWLVKPASCPPEIRKRRETDLEKIISAFTKNQKCHWRRNHELICFCNDRICNCQ